MQLVFFTVEVKDPNIMDVDTGELIQEGEVTYIDVALHELGNFCNENAKKYDYIKIRQRNIVDLVTAEEFAEIQRHLEDIENENEDLKDKLTSAWYSIDNVEEHFSELRTRLEDALSDLDDAESDLQDAKDECDTGF